jgi:hypothetical protein
VVMHAIRKRQIRWVAKGDSVGQRQFIHFIFASLRSSLPETTRSSLHSPPHPVFATESVAVCNGLGTRKFRNISY